MSAFSSTKMQINRKWKVAVNLVLGEEPEEDGWPEKRPASARPEKRHSIFPDAFTQDMAKRFRAFFLVTIIIVGPFWALGVKSELNLEPYIFDDKH